MATRLGAIPSTFLRDLAPQLVNHGKCLEWQDRGLNDLSMSREAWLEQDATEAPWQSQYLYFHAGLLALSKEHNSWDPGLTDP